KDSLVGESGAETLQAELEPILLMKGDNNRNTGWGRCREYLKPYQDQHGQTSAMFGVTENCLNFIRTVPAMVHSQTKPEDLDTDGEDHVSDELRYTVMSRPEKPTVEEKPHVLTRDEIFWKKVREQAARKLKADETPESEYIGMGGEYVKGVEDDFFSDY
ncbi:hypothetical protein KAW55_02005, partial [bacterium]|nr:hypothetical protein [bacterium]